MTVVSGVTPAKMVFREDGKLKEYKVLKNVGDGKSLEVTHENHRYVRQVVKQNGKEQVIYVCVDEDAKNFVPVGKEKPEIKPTDGFWKKYDRTIDDTFDGLEKGLLGIDSTTDTIDGANDGSLEFGEAAKHFVKGAIVSPIKGIIKHPIVSAVVGGALIAASIAFPPLGVALAWGGLIFGAATAVVGGVQVANAKTDAEARNGWENVGSGVMTAVLSFIGVRNANKASAVRSAAKNSAKPSAPVPEAPAPTPAAPTPAAPAPAVTPSAAELQAAEAAKSSAIAEAKRLSQIKTALGRTLAEAKAKGEGGYALLEQQAAEAKVNYDAALQAAKQAAAKFKELKAAMPAPAPVPAPAPAPAPAPTEPEAIYTGFSRIAKFKMTNPLKSSSEAFGVQKEGFGQLGKTMLAKTGYVKGTEIKSIEEYVTMATQAIGDGKHLAASQAISNARSVLKASSGLTSEQVADYTKAIDQLAKMAKAAKFSPVVKQGAIGVGLSTTLTDQSTLKDAKLATQIYEFRG